MYNNRKLIIIAVVIIIALIAITIIISNKNKIDYRGMTEEEIDIAVEEKMNDINKRDLSELGERDRMEYYVSSFVGAIESKDYEIAYEMLYDEFKDNYFPTISSFEEYAKSKFPSMIGIDYTNIERNNNVYVLWVTLYNPLNGRDSGIETNFVVRENNLNDFDLSFTVR